jgi:predicted metal-binding membrane protein
MPMSDGGAMPAMWTPMPGQTWPGVGVSFLAMWLAMTAAMMLPSLAPVLWRYRRSIASRNGLRRELLTSLVALGYFVVWTVFGLAALPVALVLEVMSMRDASLTRVAIGALVVAGGALQLSGWKARSLALCRSTTASHRTPTSAPGGAWRHGWMLGVRCVQSCTGLMAIQLAAGLMDLRVMAVLTVAVTLERLSPDGARVARLTGMAGIALGVVLIAQAA